MSERWIRCFGAIVIFGLGLLAGPVGAQPLPWSGASGTGVGIGVDDFGNATAEEEDISVLIPFNDRYALRLRSVLYEGFGAGLSVGEKVEFLVRSDMLLNFVRVYGGGGPALFLGLNGDDAGTLDGNWFAGDINGNWLMGAEIFFSEAVSMHWEVGTSGGAFDTGAGSYIDVGLEVYPFPNR